MHASLRNLLRGGAALLGAAPLLAQAPQFTAELLGPGILINDMNEGGQVVGWTTSGGAVRAYVAGPSGQYTLLPLPVGYASAWAQGINDAGVVVGSAAGGGFPEFGEAVAWTPDGQGGVEIFYFGTDPVDPGLPLGNGLRCVGGTTLRLGGVSIVAGSASQLQDLGAPAFVGIAPGDQRHFQFWFRDPAGGGAGFDLSDGLSLLFCD